jgi:hypothetical protein
MLPQCLFGDVTTNLRGFWDALPMPSNRDSRMGRGCTNAKLESYPPSTLALRA